MGPRAAPSPGRLRRRFTMGPHRRGRGMLRHAAVELFDVARAQRSALDILIPALDIIEGRVDDGAPPAWCEARGWTRFLLSLSDDALARSEAEGLASLLALTSDAPPSLLALA